MKYSLCGFAFIICLVSFSSLFSGIEPEGSINLPDDEIVIPESLLNVLGQKVSAERIAEKYVGLYFSASWCGPCRKFTPKLIEFRNKHSEEFEVILVGGDGSAKAQANYMKKYGMPWLAMENQSLEAKHASKVSDVEFIPFLVVLDKEGNIVTKAGKQDLTKLGDGALDYWKDL
ncbi:MAG: thioredoxin-like domain-containing protein [Verrucomicrobiota bacterium]|nr:thioredoxin-like domain-containing protein [Verrucomicrobiota bacterium]